MGEYGDNIYDHESFVLAVDKILQFKYLQKIYNYRIKTNECLFTTSKIYDSIDIFQEHIEQLRLFTSCIPEHYKYNFHEGTSTFIDTKTNNEYQLGYGEIPEKITQLIIKKLNYNKTKANELWSNVNELLDFGEFRMLQLP